MARYAGGDWGIRVALRVGSAIRRDDRPRRAEIGLRWAVASTDPPSRRSNGYEVAGRQTAGVLRPVRGGETRPAGRRVSCPNVSRLLRVMFGGAASRPQPSRRWPLSCLHDDRPRELGAELR